MPSPRRAWPITVLAVVLAASMLAPAASALDVSAKAIRVVGSQVYPDSVQSYAGETAGSPDEYDGGGVGIAVLSTGVDDEHPTFAPNAFVAGARVQNPCQIGDSDCVTDQDPGGDEEGDCIDPDDTDGHGTHTASIALGQGGAGVGPRGVAPGARLIDVKLGSSLSSISLEDVARGIDWVIRYNKGNAPCGPHPPADVIYVGYSSTEPHTSKEYDDAMQAVRNATKNDILVVTPAGDCGPGNEGTFTCLGDEGNKDTITSPGATPEALTVGAMNDRDSVRRAEDNVAGFSSRGPNPGNNSRDTDWRKPDVVAPGNEIAAACAGTGPTGGQEGEGMDCNASSSGLAAAHVAGLAAILIDARRSVPDTPAPTPEAIKELIIKSSEDVHSTGWDRATGYGYVDGYDAIVRAVNRPPQGEFTMSPHKPQVGTSVTFDASLSLDPDDDPITTYIWDFDDGSDRRTTSTPTVDHVYKETGVYTVELTVADEHERKDPTAFRLSLQVVNPPPEDPGDPPKPEISLTPTAPRVGLEAILSAEGTTDPDGHRIVEYRWDLDAQRDSFEAERSTDTETTNWTFTEAGTRLIGLRVIDEKGLSGTVYRSIVVHEAPPGPPHVNITNPQDGDVVEPGIMLASWSTENPTNNVTVYLDSVEEAHLVQRQLRLELSEGEHTLRVVARGPGGTSTDWVNFTASPTAASANGTACENATDGSCPDGHDHGAHDHGDANDSEAIDPTTVNGSVPSDENEAPVAAWTGLVASLLAALVARRRR